MPARRRYISPGTGDYVLDRGVPREDTTALPNVLIRLRTPRGSCAVLPDMGNRFAGVRKLGPQAAREAETAAAEALSDLVERGEIRDLVVRAERLGPSSLALYVAYRTRAGQAQSVSVPI